MRTQIILLACGCFNPITNMHLRLFEVAKDHLHRMGQYEVIGGIISPAHDGYGKKELEPSLHRLQMVKLSLETNDWVKLSDWEAKQSGWTRTRKVLQYHQNLVNSYLHSSENNDDLNEDVFQWLPNNIKGRCLTKKVVVKLLCGADLLESFGTPGLWADEDIEAIVAEHGLVVITRSNINPNEFIYNSDLLTRLTRHIVLVTEWIRNEISSTKIRRAIRRSESVKYLIPDNVIQYIHKNNLYGYNQTKYLSPNVFDSAYHTPSPSDPLIDSPSPTSCLYICNNNLFNNGSTKYDKISIDTVDSFKSHTFKHPGQAVKIVMDNNGGHTIVPDDIKKEVCDDGIEIECKKQESLETSNNCNDVDVIKVEHTNKDTISLNECRSCDENLIKFIFTKHGIEVLSDVETMV